MPDENRVLTVPFAVLFLATFALFCGIGIVQPVTPRLVQNGLGGNDRDVGLMSTAYAIAAVGCRPLLSLVGRRGPRALMIAGGLVSLVGFAAHLRVDSLTVLAGGRAVAAIGEAMIWVGYGTYVSALAPPGRQAEAISLSTVAVFGGIGVGPLIGDPLAREGRFDLAVLIALGFVLICALTSFALRRSWYPDSGPIRRGRLTWREVIHPAALPTGIVLAFAMVGWSAWNTFVALHGDAIGMASIAPVFTLYAVLALGFRLVGAKVPERLGLGRCAFGSLTGIALGLAVLATFPSAVGVYAGTVVLAGGVALMYPALERAYLAAGA